MSLLLYCIAADCGRELASPPSADPTPWPVMAAGLIGLVADAAAVGTGAGVDRVAAALRFGEVIEHYHRQGTVVPMRFGCRLDDEAAVARHLTEGGRRYRRLLARLDDCVEMGVRRPLPPPAVNAGEGIDAASGREYLLRRKELLSAAELGMRWLNEIEPQLRGLYREHRTEQGLFAGRPMVSAHYLVPRSTLAEFQDALRLVSGQLDARDVLVSGPWPPYSFATDDSGDGD